MISVIILTSKEKKMQQKSIKIMSTLDIIMIIVAGFNITLIHTQLH